MRRILLALLFSTFAAVPAFAVCPSPLTGKDAAGTTQNFGDTVDGSGNCYGNVGIVDGAAAANKMSVKAASTAAAQTDLAAVVRNPDVGTISDTPYTGSGNSTLSAALRGIYTDLANILTAIQAAIPPGTNTIGGVTLQSVNVSATDCSGSITTGGTAQNAFTAQTTLHGFTIANIDTTEPLWISFTTTAAASGTGSYPLAAATATTFANLSSFTAPPGFGLNHALSVIAATTSHKFSCTWW